MTTASFAPAVAEVPLRRALADLEGIDGAENPGADALLPLGPRVLSRRALDRLADVTERLWAAFRVQIAASVSADPKRLAQELGFSAHQVELIARTRFLVDAPARADFVWTRRGPRLVEWNVDPCLGGLPSHQLFERFARAGLTRGLSYDDPRPRLVTALSRLRGMSREVLVVMRSSDRPGWVTNAETFAEIAREAGFRARVVSVEQAVSAAEAALPASPLLLLRMFHVDHAPSIRGELERLFCLADAGKVRFVYGFDTELWSDKQWLAKVSLPGELSVFVPPTHPARALGETLSNDRAGWVLKPHAGAAGESVFVGCEVDDEAWTAHVARARREPGWVAQRFVEPRPVRRRYLDLASGSVELRTEIETLGIFVVEGRYAGAYSRAKPLGSGFVIDAGSSFNAVASRGRSSSRASVASSHGQGLPEELRRLWVTPDGEGVRTRLRVFENLAAMHLQSGGGDRDREDPAVTGQGFRRKRFAERGDPLSDIVRTLEADLLPFCHDKRGHGYFAHLDVPPADLSIASGILIRALAQDPVTWTSSRAGTFLEDEVVRGFAELVFPGVADAHGVPCSGGTQANLLAVLHARDLALSRMGLDVARLGLSEAHRRSGSRRLVVLASASSHGSIGAAVRRAGIGADNLVELPVDSEDRLVLPALEDALTAAARAGDLVALVVLTAGSVGVGALDPLREAIEIAHRHGARVHVDAAHGAMLLFSKKTRERLASIEEADSVTADPHKVLGLNQGLGLLLLRNGTDRDAAAKGPAPYFVNCPGAPDTSRYTLDGTRALNALGAWILLRHIGLAGYGRIVEHLLALTERFTRGIERTGKYELYARPAMNLVAFRRRYDKADDGDVARWIEAIAPTRFRVSRYDSPRGAFLRAVFVNPATTIADVDAFLIVLEELAR